MMSMGSQCLVELDEQDPQRPMSKVEKPTRQSSLEVFLGTMALEVSPGEKVSLDGQ